MKLISLNEWCSISETKNAPLEPVPQELKDLCTSPDPANRHLAAYQLPNYDRGDSFFKEWADFLIEIKFTECVEYGNKLLRWIQGSRLDGKKLLAKILNLVVVSDGVIHNFIGDYHINNTIINFNISDGKFKMPFGYWAGDFYCAKKKMVSLEGCPRKVGGGFSCSANNLTSLVGGPEEVGGRFDCSSNKLTSLEGGPVQVGGSFACRYNPLTDLTGGPLSVGGSYHCSDCKLVNLKGAPDKINGDFLCSRNELTTLDGAPRIISDIFSCDENKLTSLEGAPKKVGDQFWCGGNPTKFTREDVTAISDVKSGIYF